jgi:hypothetical protein
MISKTTVKQLAGNPGFYVSLLLPTEQKGRDTRENPIRFKNRLSEAEEQLTEAGFKQDDMTKLLGPARKLVDDYQFWQHQSVSLAVYLTPEGMETYKLPTELPERTVISKYAYVKSLAPILVNDGRFFVLAAGLGDATLFEATRYSMFELDLDELEGVPTSLAESLRFDVYEKSLNAHAAPASRSAQNDGNLMYHGHGAGTEDEKEKMLNYFKHLENGVAKFLADEQAPLVFAGLEHLFGLYKAANHYPNLLDDHIDSNAEGMDETELHKRAWQIVEPLFNKVQKQTATIFEQAAANELTSTDLEDIVIAAMDGRVETLFVTFEDVWGTLDEDERSVNVTHQATADSDDLLNVAAALTWLNGGEVYTVMPDELPRGDSIAAVYRF